MNICNFFLQNRCRYGENCKFEHPRGGGGGGTGSAQRNLFGSGGGGGNQSNQFKWAAGQQTQVGQASAQSSAMDLVNGLPKEMDAWENTKMWPFSCLSVEKELPCLPEFHDISVEEVRMEAYEMQKSGTMQAFNQKLQGLAHQYQTKRNQLRQMPMDVKQKLASFIDDARRKKTSQSSTMTPSVFGSSTPGGQQSLFGQPASNATSTGLFGQASQGTTGGGLFGKPATSSSPFGSSTFGTATSSTPSSPFGSSAFGSATSPTSLFGKPQGTTTPSLFGSTTPQSGQSLFGGGQNLTATPIQPGTGIFGSGGHQPTTTNLFGSSASSTSLFGKPANAQPNASSVFGSFGNTMTGTSNNPMPAPGLFGKPTPTPTGGLFGGSQNPVAPSPGLFGENLSTPSTTPPTGLFGKPAPPPSGLFGVGPATAPPGGGLLPTPTSGGGLLPIPTTGDAGLFGKGPQPLATSSSGFGLFGSNPQAPNSSQGSVFGGSVGGTAVTSKESAVPSGGPDLANKGYFSSMEQLTPLDIEAFKASEFTLGKIPIKPPPKELTII